MSRNVCFLIVVVPLCCSACDRNARRPDPAPLASDSPPETNVSAFADVTAESGIRFEHAVEPVHSHFFPEIMSPGAAFVDFDQDGDLDVYLVNGGDSRRRQDDSDAPLAGNRLFRQDADGRFMDVTDQSGLGDRNFGMGVAIGDVNNDGYPDVYVTNYGPDRLFLNRGDGTFVDVTERAGITNDRWSASAAFFDYDRDGWLDLFVTNYVDYQPYEPCYDTAGRLDYCSPAVFPRTSDTLYRNLPDSAAGDGDADVTTPRFEDVSLSSGIADEAGAGLGVICTDLSGDGWPDIYVANDGHANRLWVNQRDGTFRDEAALRGLAYDALGRGQAGMGTALGDLNNDGAPDILLTHLEGENNAAYLSSDQGTFRESSRSLGIFDDSLPWTGFGLALFDFEHDGDLDLAVVNGRVRRSSAFTTNDDASPGTTEDGFWNDYAEHNQLFWNDGSGHFSLRSHPGDPFSNPCEVSRALVCGDVDNDGDVDLLISNTAGVARLFRNDVPKAGHWLLVRAVDPLRGGRDAYGAEVSVTAAGKRRVRFLAPGTGYLGSHDPRVHFGLGAAAAYDRVDVRWPDGVVESFPGDATDQVITLERGRGTSP